jgi:hypothetical protein
MEESGYRLLGFAIVGVIAPFFWWVALSLPLWFVRKFARPLEWWLYAPLSKVISRLGSLILVALRSAWRASR